MPDLSPSLMGPSMIARMTRGVASATKTPAAAVASLRPEAERELMARVDAVVSERERVCAALARLGWEVPRSEANFVWLPLPDDGAAAGFAAAAEAAGVSVRPFAGAGVRVTVAEPAAGDVFLRVAADWLG